MILYTSVTNYKKIYLIIIIVTFIFAQIYNLFSHNVYSIFMTYAFIIPLIFDIILKILKTRKVIKLNLGLYTAGAITLTIYSLMRGFLEIYGTTNNLINIYLFVGIILFLISLLKC